MSEVVAAALLRASLTQIEPKTVRSGVFNRGRHPVPEDEVPSETRQTSAVVVSALLQASLMQYRAERPVPRAEQISPRLPKSIYLLNLDTYARATGAPQKSVARQFLLLRRASELYEPLLAGAVFLVILSRLIERNGVCRALEKYLHSKLPSFYRTTL